MVFILLENRGKLVYINSEENFRKNKPNKAVLKNSDECIYSVQIRVVCLLI